MNEQQCKSQKKPRGIDREGGREGGGSSKLKLFPSKVPDTKVAFTKTFDVASWLLAKAVFLPKEPD